MDETKKSILGLISEKVLELLKKLPVNELLEKKEVIEMIYEIKEEKLEVFWPALKEVKRAKDLNPGLPIFDRIIIKEKLFAVQSLVAN